MKTIPLAKKCRKAKKARNTMRVNHNRKTAAIILMSVARSRRIPQTQPEFNTYLNEVVGYLSHHRRAEPNTRGQMLGMSAADVAVLVSWRARWKTGNPAAPGLWELHENVYGDTQTKTVNDNVKKFMKDFRAYFQPVLNDIAAHSAVDLEDKNILHIAHGRSKHAAKPAITKKL